MRIKCKGALTALFVSILVWGLRQSQSESKGLGVRRAGGVNSSLSLHLKAGEKR